MSCRGWGMGDSGAGARWFATLALLLALGVAGCAKEKQPASASEPAAAAADDSAAEHAAKHADPLYRCPMHPDVVRNAPGQCPICGMDLVEVEPEPAEPTDTAGPEVRISPAVVRRARPFWRDGRR